ncbi:MAG: hypothetical protein E7Z92_03025 [Cyanobacteria bacterium SIG31]|nr:hypothetical protein [Cyanobacteria bacterium SIG31]
MDADSSRVYKLNTFTSVTPTSVTSTSVTSTIRTPRSNSINSTFGSGYNTDSDSSIDISTQRNCYTKDEIVEMLKSFCENNKINYESFLANNPIETISGYSLEELLKQDKNEVDKVFKALEDACGGIWGDWSLKALFGKNRDENDIKNILSKAKENFLYGERNFWNRLGNVLGLNKTIEDAIRKELNIKKNQEITENDVLEYAETMRNKISSTTNLEEKIELIEKLRKFYNETLITNNKKLKALLPHLNDLFDNNCTEFDRKVLLALSSDPELQSSAGKNIVTNTLAQRIDNENITSEIIQESTQIAFEVMNDADTKDSIQKINEKNIDNKELINQYEELLEKEKNGTLTDEERAVLNKIRKLAATSTGATVGITNNENIKESKNEYISTIITNADANGLGEEVIEQVNKINPEILTIKPESSTEIQNIGTSNGTEHVETNVPTNNCLETNNSTNTGSTSCYTTPVANISSSSKEYIASKPDTNSKTAKTTDKSSSSECSSFKEALAQGTSATISYIQKHGPLAIVEIFKLDNIPEYIEQYAINLFKREDNSSQITLLTDNRLGGNAFSTLINVCSDITLESLYKQPPSSHATQTIEKTIENRKKDKNSIFNNEHIA